MAIFRHAEGVLQFATAGKDVPSEALGDPQRGRSVSPGAPDRIGLSPCDPYHAVVGTHMDGPVVDQEVIGDVPDLLEDLPVPVGNGLVGVVAAGHY